MLRIHGPLRLGVLLCGLLLQGCGGGGGDSPSGGGGTSDNPDSTLLASYWAAADLAAYGCALNGNYRDCDALDNWLNYFNRNCSRGNAYMCQLSQDLQANYMMYRLIRR